MEYPQGSTAVSVSLLDRKAKISATPATVPAGGRVRIAAGGFPVGATLRISISGQPDFTVKADSGAFAWDALVPTDAPSGLVTLRAAQVDGTMLAVGSYVVQSAASTLAQLKKLRGDLQTGYPGTRLAQPLQIQVVDEFGSAIAGLPVKFTPSPGASIEAASTLTDENGMAQAFLRLPLLEAPALATAEAGRQVITFRALTQPGSLRNFPKFVQGTTPQTRGALLNAAAAVVRYLQDSGQAAAPNGPSEPILLNQFLSDFCVFGPGGDKICDGFLSPPGGSSPVLNLWRLSAFAGGNLDVEPVDPTPALIRDRLALGLPVLLALNMNGQSHFVVAIGVANGGAVFIHDPSATFSRGTLDEYLAGFTAGGTAWKATIAAAIQIQNRTPSPFGFLVATAGVQAAIASVAGACGFSTQWPELEASAGIAGTGTVRFSYCDGQQSNYQLDLGGAGKQAFSLTDLGQAGGRSVVEATAPASFRLSKPRTSWEASLQQLSFAAAGVRNGASFKEVLSPGVLLSIFGQGLSVAGQDTTLEIGERPAQVINGTPFQLNAAAPLDLPPGNHVVRLRSPYGVAEQTVSFDPVSPAVFQLAPGKGAILNQDGNINSAAKPARRGQAIVVYLTGLGAVRQERSLLLAQEPVSAQLNGRSLTVLYAGTTPGFPGLYQLNLLLAQDMPPGLDQKLTIQQGGVAVEPILVAVQ
jgi:uncharacterized protein (TIGR03437 family)